MEKIFLFKEKMMCEEKKIFRHDRSESPRNENIHCGENGAIVINDPTFMTRDIAACADVHRVVEQVQSFLGSL